MNKMNLTITARENNEIVETATASSISRMWVENKKLFAAHPAARVTVTDENETVIKDLILVTKKSGKAWMQNFIPQTEEKKEKTEEELKAEKEAAEKEEKRRKHNEANRLYRLKKKAEKEAADTAAA